MAPMNQALNIPVPEAHKKFWEALKAAEDVSALLVESARSKKRQKAAPADGANMPYVYASLDWLKRAAVLPGKAALVAIELSYLYGVKRENPVKLSYAGLKCISRQAIYRALDALQDGAGLISYHTEIGQSPVVTFKFDPVTGKPISVVSTSRDSAEVRVDGD